MVVGGPTTFTAGTQTVPARVTFEKTLNGIDPTPVGDAPAIQGTDVTVDAATVVFNGKVGNAPTLTANSTPQPTPTT